MFAKGLLLRVCSILILLGLGISAEAAPNIQFDSFQVIGDDGDGAIEPNECVDFTITLKNTGDISATGVSGTLTSAVAGVTVPAANATQVYSDILPGGGTSTNTTPFKLSVSSGFVCNLPIQLVMNVSSNEGDFTVPVTLPTGSVPPTVLSFSQSLNKKIKDGHGQTNTTLTVSGVSTIVNVSASVWLTHDRDSDLTIDLIGPDGTTVDLSSGNGGTGADYGTGSASSETTNFDDSASTSITSGAAPFVGTFKPEGSLSVFNGKTGTAANGLWRLRVRDRVRNGISPQARLQYFLLKISQAGVCGAGGVCNPGSEPVLYFGTASVIDAPDDAIDVNDCFDLSVSLRNDGTASATSIAEAALSTSTPGVTVLQPVSDYADIAPGTSSFNLNSFQLQTSPDFECGSEIQLMLTGTTISSIAPGTPIPFSIPITLTAGTPSSPSNVTPVPIIDNLSSGVDSTINVSGITGTVGKVTVDLNITHMRDSDLTISLIGPDNTEVLLSSGNGGDEPDYGFDCDDPTNFDDAAATPITSGIAPFPGSYIPQESLSAFSGKDPNGTWRLHVVDNVTGEEGQIECWTLKLSTCNDGACCPTITLDDTLADSEIGTSYNGTISANGGTGPYNFTITSGTLPDGLTLNSDGTITGTPAASGTFNFTVQAKTASGCKGSNDYSITIACPAISLNDTLSDGTTGIIYSGAIEANGGAAPYSYSLNSGSLPTGLTLNTDGTITGTPTAAGDFTFEVIATDINGCTGNSSYSVTISCATISLDDTLPDGTTGAGYNGTIQATGGSAPYTYILESGSLPSGLTLHLDGTITGTPSASGTFTFEIKTTDDYGCEATQSYSVTVSCSTIALDDTLADGVTGTAYNGLVLASGGTAPFSYSVTGGAIPNGLSFAPNGTINGTPTSSGTFSFEIQATDLYGCTGTSSYSITVECPAITLDDTLADATTGVAFSGTILASGGTAPYSYSLSNGNLPDGLLLNSDGTISGTPTSAGTFNFSIQASDNFGCTGTLSYSVDVACPAITLDDTLSDGIIGTSYNGSILASGGTAPYSYSLSNGNLPDGLTLNIDGTISGTSTVPGTFNFDVTATDNFGCTGTQSYSISTACSAITLDDTLADGTTGISYSGAILASGGTAPYGFTLSAGNLPDGLTLNANGNVTGIPSVSSTFNFSVAAVDAFGCSGTLNYSITISCDTISLDQTSIPGSNTLPNAQLGTNYSETITAAGGAGPYVFTSSALPDGLTLNPNTGEISGTPSSLIIGFNVTITATDSLGCSGSKIFEVTILAPACEPMTLSSLPNSAVGEAYSTTISVTGGSGPYTFAVVNPANLPPGLTFNPTSGELSGIPTDSGSFTFTITATDSFSCDSNRQYTVSICLFCDDFEDGTRSSEWTYTKPNWVESNGNLAGTPVRKKAIAVAQPAFDGCQNCTVTAAMQTAGGIGNRVWLYSWYLNKKNTVELMMKQESGKWVLKQRINGRIVAKGKGIRAIQPNVSYQAEVSFDGTQFHVSIDNIPLFDVTAAGTVPAGTVGFASKNTTASFGEIVVN